MRFLIWEQHNRCQEESSDLQHTLLLQEGRPLPRPESGLLSNSWKWVVWWDTQADKAKNFIGKRRLDREQVKGNQEVCFAMGLAVLGFMVMGLVSGLHLANYSDLGSFPVAHALLCQDGCQQEGFWEVLGHVTSPFDLSWTLSVGGGLLVPCSLLGPSVLK